MAANGPQASNEIMSVDVCEDKFEFENPRHNP